VWFDSTSGKNYVRYDSHWVEDGAASFVSTANHAIEHVRDGTDIIDGDRLQVDFSPSGYTRNSSAANAGAITDLTAHLSGIDRKLSAAEGLVGSIYPDLESGSYTLGTSVYRWQTVFGQNANFNGTVTIAANIIMTGLVQGNLTPSSTNGFDLGTTSLRWRNIYTQDLHLSNGIGDYTIIEGEEDLFLVNNKNGKSYKFALVEVDADIIPPKSEQG
jgi:hypothetical protein